MCEATLSSIGTRAVRGRVSNFTGPPIHGMSCGMVIVSSSIFRLLHVLPFAEWNVAQRARREQLLEFHPPVGQSVLMGILEQRLDRRAVRLDPVGEPVRP